MYAPLSPRLHW